MRGTNATYAWTWAALCLLLTARSDSGQGDATSASVAMEPADFVFTNGEIYTIDAINSTAQALAVRGNEIVYVGDDAGATKRARAPFRNVEFFYRRATVKRQIVSESIT